MQGRGQMFIFVMFLIFILGFMFFRNIIRRDKELKKQREEAIREKIESEIIRENQLRFELERKREKEIQRQKELLYRMKENPFVCYDIQVLIFRPEKNKLRAATSSGTKNSSLKSSYRKRSSFMSNDESEEQMKARRSMISGPIAYLFVIVLIYSLAKATTEISQHFRKKANGEAEKRRCSLQEYAGLKYEHQQQQQQRRSSKAQLTRRSTINIMNKRAKSFNQSFEERRISQTIPEASSISSQSTEPASPAKISSGLATKPAPLLRRCSVPAFSLGTSSKLRRTSMDSFSEDDSSPDVKRRVRMIHRH